MPVNIDLHRFHSPLFESVVKQAFNFFLTTPLHTLPPDESFGGAGVYAIYLLEHATFYKYVADKKAIRPIYVGKAVSMGWRTGRGNHLVESQALSGRIREHSRSISQVTNLNIEFFRCRFIILNGVESDLISPIEAELIRTYKPLWNTWIDGFGNHDPGSGRYNQALSEWDLLHPGRTWATRLTGTKPDLNRIISKIQAYVDQIDN